MTTRVDRLIAELDSLPKDDLARKIREVVAAEREDELESFLVHDDGIRRDELGTLDVFDFCARFVYRLRDEGFAAPKPNEIPLVVVACTRPADSLFESDGTFLAHVPRS